MPRILAGASLAIHSPTGSGKTLAYLLPLALRMMRRPDTPRQALVVVPTRELALQSLEYVHAICGTPAPVALVHSSSAQPAVVADAMRRHSAPMIIVTAAQLGALDGPLSPSSSAAPTATVSKGDLLAELRRTLRTIVLDESDATLEPRGRGGKMNRARRDRALRSMPAARVLQQLVKRRTAADAFFPQGDSGSSGSGGKRHHRVQLVVASATLSRSTMRDLAAVVGRGNVGKMGLATPVMAINAGQGRWLQQNATDADSGHLQQLAVGVAPAWSEAEAMWTKDQEPEDRQQQRQEAAGLKLGGTSARREGYGVRGGLLHAGVPAAISHEMVVCSEHRKTAVIAELLTLRPGPALLVVRDGLRLEDVMAELRAEGIVHAIDLSALAIVAARHHDVAARAAAAADEVAGSGVSGGDRSGGSAAAVTGRGGMVPEWAHLTGQSLLPPSQPADGAGANVDDGAASCDVEEQAAHEAAVASAGTLALRAGAERWELIVAHESAIRGLDMPQLQLVLVSMVPSSPEAYIHIAGRTGRAGRRGRAVSIWTPRELDQAGAITRAVRARWTVHHDATGTS